MVGVYQWTLCWRCVSDFRLMSRSSAGWYTTPWAHHKVAACKFRGCESKLDTYYCYTICVPDKGYSTGVCFVALGDPIQFLFLLLPWSAPCCKMLAQQTMHSFEWLPLHHCYKIVLHSFLSFFEVMLHSFLNGMTVGVRGCVQDPLAKEEKKHSDLGCPCKSSPKHLHVAH